MRASGRELSAYLVDRHLAQGTKIILGGQVSGARVDGSGGVGGVVLEDGTRIECDCVLIGVGTLPNDRLAREADLVCDRGVVVDERTLTELDPAICAIGDVTHRPLNGYAKRVRLGASRARTSRRAKPWRRSSAGEMHSPEVPWFWSDQFDLKIQIADS